MYRMAVLLCVLLCAMPCYAGDDRRAELVRVVDGDTIIVNIAEWPAIVGEAIGIRVNGCDTPELRDKRPEMRAKAKQAKAALLVILERAEVITLRNIERGKYFRLVADVYADESNVSDLLIASGLALPYDGGTKPW